MHTTFIYVTHDQTEAMTMGSRIAVLNGGFVQQLGAPQELYDHPANLFVAGFIGSPAMNFFPGAQVASDGDSTKIVLENIGEVEVPPLYASQAREAAGKKLTFGIRPEHLEDMALMSPENQNGSSINAKVDVIENLGSELLVYLTTGSKTIQARLNPRSNVHMGSDVRLHVDTENIHLFDTETEQAIF